MIQLVAFAAVGAVVWVGYSSFKKRMDEIRSAEEKKQAEESVVVELKKDPQTGRYRPKDNDRTGSG